MRHFDIVIGIRFCNQGEYRNNKLAISCYDFHFLIFSSILFFIAKFYLINYMLEERQSETNLEKRLIL